MADPVPFPAEKTALLTVHFGDPAWVELLLRRVHAAFPEIADERVFVVDQDRRADSAAMLKRLLGSVRILHYPASEAHFAITGHDHAYVLNLAVRDIEAEFLMLFDSDAHPVSPAARARLAPLIAERDAVLAAKRETGKETHPCFMLFGPAVDRDRLAFDAGQLETGVDTGREIYHQVEQLGLQGELLRPTKAFGGHWGSLYLGGSIYHHGSGSFPSNPDRRIQRQVASWRQEEKLFRRRVFRGEYTLSRGENWLLGALLLRRRLAGAVRRRLRR